MSSRPPLKTKPPATSPEAEEALRRLLDIMSSLRNPESGCAWDIEQTHESIAPYTIEEAYEVSEAIKSGTSNDLRDELGDLLLQVVFQARIAEEKGNFDFTGITDSISEKMLRRHPHIFDDAHQRTSEEQKHAWEDIKAEERKARNKTGILADIATSLPPMTRAIKLQNRAARVGFDWDNPKDVMSKVTEELEEVIKASPMDRKGEIGDLLFAVINLSRHLEIDPNEALSETNRKFTARFGHIESQAQVQGTELSQMSLSELETLWRAAKAKESS